MVYSIGVVERSRWTLRQERRKCGKCEKLHGPYWYGYRRVRGRLVSHYFGRSKPSAAELRKLARAAQKGKP